MRQLGNSGQLLPAVGLGCMGMVGWYGQRDDREARATIDRALEIGIQHLDTAAVYQDGDNERFVGDCIRGRRAEVFLATKCGFVRGADGRLGVDTRPEQILASCDASLARLGTDYIDLFYLHRIDPRVPVEDSMGALADLQVAGKIRFAGLSEASAQTLREAHRVLPVAALQSELSLWTRAPAQPALDACEELGVTFVAYSPLGRGFLTGTIRTVDDLPSGDTRLMFPRFDRDNLAHNLELAARVRELAAEHDCTPAQLALAWVLAQSASIVSIPGTKKRRYLDENAAAVDVGLTQADLELIAERLPEELVHGARYPDSMMAAIDA